MRQSLTIADEPHLVVRSLCVDYNTATKTTKHAHSWAQLVYSASGAVRAQFEQETWIVPPNRALWIPAHLTHQLNMLGQVQLRTLYFRQAQFEQSQQPIGLEVPGLLQAAILRVCEQQVLDARIAPDLNLAALIEHEIQRSTNTQLKLPMPTDPRARQLANHFLTSALVSSTLAEVLPKFGLSRRTAERLFVAETGLSPARWYRFARICKALQHLSDGGTIDDAAAVAGFQSRSAFSQAFSTTLGLSPSEARANSGVLRNAASPPPSKP